MDKELEGKCIMLVAKALDMNFEKAEELWVYYLETLKLLLRIGDSDEVQIEGGMPVAVIEKIQDGTLKLRPYEPPFTTRTVQ